MRIEDLYPFRKISEHRQDYEVELRSTELAELNHYAGKYYKRSNAWMLAAGGWMMAGIETFNHILMPRGIEWVPAAIELGSFAVSAAMYEVNARRKDSLQEQRDNIAAVT